MGNETYTCTRESTVIVYVLNCIRVIGKYSDCFDDTQCFTLRYFIYVLLLVAAHVPALGKSFPVGR